MCRALSFHNNLHAASVFITQAGDWKLAGLESVCGLEQEPPVQVLPSTAKYSPPERNDPSKARLTSSWAADVLGLGCLVWEVFNGDLPSMENLVKLGDIPKSLQPTYKECFEANPGKRPRPSDILTKLRRSPGFFKNDLIDIAL